MSDKNSNDNVKPVSHQVTQDMFKPVKLQSEHRNDDEMNFTPVNTQMLHENVETRVVHFTKDIDNDD